MSERNLQDKVVLITGGGGGIGSATALRLARSGAAVAVVDLFIDAAQSAVDAIRAEGNVASAFQADLGGIDQVHRVFAEVLNTFGHVDILVNNAVLTDREIYAKDLKLAEVEVEHWDKIFAVNLRAPMLLSKLSIPGMIERGGGVIINMSSGASTHGLPDMLTAYGTTKGALNTLTLYTAAQYGRQNVRCNALVCGAVLTPSLKALFPPQFVEQMGRDSLTGRAKLPEDIAAFIHFLASPDAGQITGQLYPI